MAKSTTKNRRSRTAGNTGPVPEPTPVPRQETRYRLTNLSGQKQTLDFGKRGQGPKSVPHGESIECNESEFKRVPIQGMLKALKWAVERI